MNQKESEGVVHTSKVLPQPLKKVLNESYPAIHKVALVSNHDDRAFKKGNELLQMQGKDASPELFEIFGFPFVQGGYELMYDVLESVVISEKFADHYFGSGWRSRNVVGESIRDDKGENFKIAGVFRDLPAHSTLRFEFVVPFKHHLKKKQWVRRWGNYMNDMYVEISDNVSLAEANEQIATAIIDHRNNPYDSSMIFAQAFKDLYLFDRYENRKVAGGKIRYVKFLSLAATLILLIGCINFINLSTSRAIKRAKEIGIRKTLGALRSSLRMQFFTESFLTVMPSVVIASIILCLTLPVFNDLTQKTLHLDPTDLNTVGMILLFGFSLTVLSAIYQACYLSSFVPIDSLKLKITNSRSNLLIRKGLVTMQFAIASMMIISAIAINRQVSFLLNRHLGFDKSNLIQVPMENIKLKKNFETFKNELLSKEGRFY